jgi:hypothetical protein
MTRLVNVVVVAAVLSAVLAGCASTAGSAKAVTGVPKEEVLDGLSGPAGLPTVTVTSNEPENGTGDGDLAPDFVISGGAVQVRAERAGNGSGRIYTITATASDLAGNTTTQTATGKVPHDYGRTAQH